MTLRTTGLVLAALFAWSTRAQDSLTDTNAAAGSAHFYRITVTQP